MQEKWSIIDNYPGYKVSNLGRVIDVIRDREKKVQFFQRGGYPYVQLKGKDGRYDKVLLHRLVALAFVDGYFEGAEVRFNDNNKTNYIASNLRWAHPSDRPEYRKDRLLQVWDYNPETGKHDRLVFDARRESN